MTVSPFSPLTDAEWAERTERLQAAHERALDSHPKRCGQCGSSEVAAMFDPDLLLWQCSTCDDVFPERS
jgi:hypothetical protein